MVGADDAGFGPVAHDAAAEDMGGGGGAREGLHDEADGVAADVVGDGFAEGGRLGDGGAGGAPGGGVGGEGTGASAAEPEVAVVGAHVEEDQGAARPVADEPGPEGAEGVSEDASGGGGEAAGEGLAGGVGGLEHAQHAGAGGVAHGLEGGVLAGPQDGGDGDALGHLLAGRDHAHEHLRVGAHELPDLRRQAGQTARIVPQAEQEGHGPEHASGEHDPGGAVGPRPPGPRSPALADVHLVAPVPGPHGGHLAEVADLEPVPLRQPEVVAVEGVLGAVAAAHHAAAAVGAARAVGALALEERVGHRFARLAEEDADGGGRMVALPAERPGDGADGPVRVRVVGDLGGPEHAPGGGVMGSQLSSPVGEVAPGRGGEEGVVLGLLEHAPVDQGAAAHADAGQRGQVAQEGHPERAPEAEGGGPEPAAQVPGGAGEVVRAEPGALLEHEDPVALLDETEAGDAAAEPGPDDDEIPLPLHGPPRRDASALAVGHSPTNVVAGFSPQRRRPGSVVYSLGPGGRDGRQRRSTGEVSHSSQRSPTVETQGTGTGRFGPMQGLFYLVSVLVVGAIGYAAWIVISYWDRVGV